MKKIVSTMVLTLHQISIILSQVTMISIATTIRMRGAFPMDPGLLPPLLTADQLAELLQTTPAALAQDRYQGRGVPYTRVGRRIRYLKDDVLKYLRDNRIGAA